MEFLLPALLALLGFAAFLSVLVVYCCAVMSRRADEMMKSVEMRKSQADTSSGHQASEGEEE